MIVANLQNGIPGPLLDVEGHSTQSIRHPDVDPPNPGGII